MSITIRNDLMFLLYKVTVMTTVMVSIWLLSLMNIFIMNTS